jgi:NADH:ubiquinone oxidoreductase subunit F (NADH-binding)
VTGVLPGRGLDREVAVVGTPRLLAGLDRAPVVGSGAHQSLHGRLPLPTRERLVTMVEGVALRGRGGAAFPVGRKLRATPDAASVLVNGHESEPASHKDRVLMRRVPHLVLDGALAVASALGSREVVVAVADPLSHHALVAASHDRHDAGSVRIASAPGGFVAGEARALVRGVDGGQAVPPGRRVLPTVRGLRGRPSFVSNVETFAQIALLVRMGVAAFGHTGESSEPGTTLVTVSGAVTRPGVVEIPTGLPADVVLRLAGARAVQALAVGGYHGAWLAPSPALRLSRDGIAAAGGVFGAGVLAVVGDETCGLGELARVTHWLADQSSGRCGPCRNGLPALAGVVDALWHGRPDDGTAAVVATLVDGRGACAHPDGAARFVRSGLHVLAAEVAAHSSGGCGRSILGQLPVGEPA